MLYIIHITRDKIQEVLQKIAKDLILERRATEVTKFSIVKLWVRVRGTLVPNKKIWKT